MIDNLETVPKNIFTELKSAGEDFSQLNCKGNNEILCKQMIALGTKHRGNRIEEDHIRDALNIFFRNRNYYNPLRKYLVLPSDRTLRTYFGKLGTVGSMEECKIVVKNVFDEIHSSEKSCFVAADEMYVKPAVRYRLII